MEVILGLVGIIAVGFVLYLLLNKKEVSVKAVEETVKEVEEKAVEVAEKVEQEVVEAVDIISEKVKKATKRGRPSSAKKPKDKKAK
jgi:hypothetical protein